MSWLPKSAKARRRLTLVAAIAPVLALAVGLTLWGLRDSISFFYTPSQAAQAHPPAGRSIQLGGMVRMGSVLKHADGRVEFVVADRTAQDRGSVQGDLPDLVREGQGVVAVDFLGRQRGGQLAHRKADALQGGRRLGQPRGLDAALVPHADRLRRRRRHSGTRPAEGTEGADGGRAGGAGDSVPGLYGV